MFFPGWPGKASQFDQYVSEHGENTADDNH